MGEFDNYNVANELRKMNSQLAVLTEGQANQGEDIAEIKVQVKATNGRVTALEAQKIAQDAVEKERTRLSIEFDEKMDDARDSRSKLVDRAIGSGVTLLAVIVGALLTDIQIF